MASRQETKEQIAVVRELRAMQTRTKDAVRHFAVPNGERRDKATAIVLKQTGVVAGVPDILILGKLPGGPAPLTREELNAIREAVADEEPSGLVPRMLATIDQARGIALEMKKEDGVSSDISPDQHIWLPFLRALGWDVLVGWGAVDALRKLKALGLPVTVSDGPIRPNGG